MAVRCTVVIRGISSPLSVDFTSSMAEALAVVLSVLMATCPKVKEEANKKRMVKITFVFMIV
jgi:hypothetical protein